MAGADRDMELTQEVVEGLREVVNNLAVRCGQIIAPFFPTDFFRFVELSFYLVSFMLSALVTLFSLFPATLQMPSDGADPLTEVNLNQRAHEGMAQRVPRPQCSLCGAEGAKNKCGQCKSVFYCSAACQKVRVNTICSSVLRLVSCITADETCIEPSCVVRMSRKLSPEPFRTIAYVHTLWILGLNVCAYCNIFSSIMQMAQEDWKKHGHKQKCATHQEDCRKEADEMIAIVAKVKHPEIHVLQYTFKHASTLKSMFCNTHSNTQAPRNPCCVIHIQKRKHTEIHVLQYTFKHASTPKSMLCNTHSNTQAH